MAVCLPAAVAGATIRSTDGAPTGGTSLVGDTATPTRTLRAAAATVAAGDASEAGGTLLASTSHITPVDAKAMDALRCGRGHATALVAVIDSSGGVAAGGRQH